jgi:hypothetical protein
MKTDTKQPIKAIPRKNPLLCKLCGKDTRTVDYLLCMRLDCPDGR